MFYISISRVFLQIMLYNTNINALIGQKDDNKYNTNNDSFVGLRSKLDKKIEEHKECAKLYGKLVKKFIDDYRINYKTYKDYETVLTNNMCIPYTHLIDTFKEYCQQTILSFLTKNDISENEQKFFNYHADLFFDSTEFVLQTIHKIKFDCKLFKFKEGNEKIKEICKDGKLIKKLILMCNWIQKITCNTNVCFLYNINSIVIIRHDNVSEVRYDMVIVPSKRKKNFSNIDFLIQSYFLDNIADTLEDIIANENVEKILEWIKVNKKIDIGEDEREIITTIFQNIALEKSHETKIAYLAKELYYDQTEDVKNRYKRTIEHTETIKKLNLEEAHPNFYKLNISAYCMYKEETIIDTTNIIELINKNIDDVIQNAKIITEHLFELVKRRMCDVLQKHKNTITTSIADPISELINDITKLSMQEIIDKSEEKTIEHITKDFYSKMMETIDDTKKTTQLKQTEIIDRMGLEIRNNIYPKYTTLIEKVELLNKIKKETKIMPDCLRKNMKRIEECTNIIGIEGKDYENIYLGLTPIDNDKGETNIHNERKLCELQIMEIMEKVIGYKSMIVKTEEYMLELINEIRDLQIRSV